jgi:membrane protein YqaA with SNARE-associated domain
VKDERHWLDRFVHSSAAQVAAFSWRLAEATVFFIVPDVLLTVLSCRSIRIGSKAVVAATLGALAGGLVMYAAGSVAPDASRAFLVRVPAVHPQLVERVQSQLSEYDLTAVLIGPIQGVPYKIYAVEWGATRRSLPAFLLISIPARGIRFLAAVLLANVVARALSPLTRRRQQAEMAILAIGWTGFYAFYFHRFGW